MGDAVLHDAIWHFTLVSALIHIYRVLCVKYKKFFNPA